MKATLVVFAVLLTINGALGFWTNCPAGPVPHAVTSPLCTDTKCSVRRGGSLLGTATFSATANHVALQSTVHAVVLGSEINLTGDDPTADEVCLQLQGAACPLVAGNRYTWNLNFHVPQSVPVLQDTIVRIRIRDGAAIVACTQVIADILA